MSGSPPQMETIGASHSSAAARHFSSGTMSLRLVEYSRIRPQPVQVKLHVCSGSSCRTIANFGVLRSLCLIMWPAIFADSASGNRIVGLVSLSDLRDRPLCRVGKVRECWLGIVLQKPRQQESGRRNTVGIVDAATADPQGSESRNQRKSYENPRQSHLRYYRWARDIGNT